MSVTPAKAGVQGHKRCTSSPWIPTCAGMANDANRGWNGNVTRRQRSDPPSGCGRIRQSAFTRRLPPIAPAPQQKGDDAGALRGELQPAAHHRGEHPDFADHRDDAGSAQPLLHRPQDLGVARCPDQHETRRIEPVGGDPGPVEIRAGQAPQHHAVSRRTNRPHLTPTLSAPKSGEGEPPCLTPLSALWGGEGGAQAEGVGG